MDTPKKKKVLIVEDEATLLQALGAKFSIAGYETLLAPDGEVGLTSALNEQPDIILLDVLLPKMDGLTMFQKLREDPRGKDIPVIFLSNSSDMETVAQATVYGAHDYLVKTDMKLDDVVRKAEERMGVAMPQEKD